MSPKARAVCEKLSRQNPGDVLAHLLRFEVAGEDQDWRYCCQTHPGSDDEHDENCPLDKMLKDIGLPDREAREAMREELGEED